MTMTPIIMPQIGQDITKGKIIEWRKRENDPVAKGEVVVIVESEKATFEVEAEESGVLLKIVHEAGDEEVEILTPVGYIGLPGERFDEQQAAEAPVAEEKAKPSQERPAPPEADIVLASPAVRRLAREKGIDLAHVAGSGPGGRIVKRDILVPMDPSAVSDAGEDTIVPFSRMRKRIAERLTLSKRTIPHFNLVVDVDMTDAQKWRRGFNAVQGIHVTVTDLLIKVAAVALKKFPRLNAHVADDKLVVKRHVNIGVAVAVEDGLLVPVIPDADRKPLPEISAMAGRNADAARRGVISMGPGGTFTITSLGMHAVRQFVPIINPPEAAILGVGGIEPRAVAVETGQIAVRSMMTLTLACDHRAVDGSAAAALLNEIKTTLQSVEQRVREWV